MVERVLGEVPNVAKVHWDWREQLGYVRFGPDGPAKEEDLVEAIARRTMYSAGRVTFIERLEDLPDALR